MTAGRTQRKKVLCLIVWLSTKPENGNFATGLQFVIVKPMKKIVVFLGIIFAFCLTEKVASQVFVPLSCFDSLLRKNAFQLDGKVLSASVVNDGLEAIVSATSGRLYRFNVFPLNRCGVLPGKLHETRFDNLPVYLLQTGRLSYLQLAHYQSSSCIQLTADGEMADSLLVDVFRKSGLRDVRAAQISWPEQVPPELRLSGCLLRIEAHPSTIEGFVYEVKATMLHDSVLQASVQAAMRQYHRHQDFIETDQAVLTFSKGSIPSFLNQKPRNEAVTFHYYLRK